jgi:hypothetical protein
MNIRWIPDEGLEVATAPDGYLLKVYQSGSDWDWQLFQNDELIVHGAEYTEQDAKHACLRAYQEHAGAFNA